MFHSSDFILSLILGFADKNPGICRLLTGDALIGEQERLRERVVQFFDRIEVQLKQALREAQMQEQLGRNIDVAVTANLLMAVVEGRIQQFVRSGFKRSPLEHWNAQLSMMLSTLG